MSWYRDGIAGWKKAGLPVSYSIKLGSVVPDPIEAAQLHRKLLKKENLFLIDLRDEASINNFGRIEGPTLNYPLYRLHSLSWELPKNRLLVLYDIRGKQTPTAAKYLITKSLKKELVTWLKGGVVAWQEKGLPMKTEE